MNKITFVLLLGLLAISGINAQTNFQPGYVLISEKDTTFGFVDNNDYYTNSQYCSFKRTDTSKIVKYLPNSIYGYRFSNGKFYISKEVEIDNKKVNLFMEYLVHGRLDLYFFRNKDSKDCYFAAKDTLPLVELKYSKKYVLKDGVEIIKESKDYIGPLAYLTSDCPSIKNEIPAIESPDQKKLINFAQKYHKQVCTNQECIIYHKKMPPKLCLNVYGGIAYYNNFLIQDQSDSKIFQKQELGFEMLFQIIQRSENTFLGVGLRRVPGTVNLILDNYQIPITFNYINHGKGIAPTFSYEFDMSNVLTIQALRLGLNYRFNKMALGFRFDLTTFKFITPIGVTANLGLYFNLN